ncbi:MAG TPA: hypothetical protein VLB44_07075, partial [Kofleriaceae bacterium]|nr:hypothetical protein [Kofleriaceae bacterium]
MCKLSGCVAAFFMISGCGHTATYGYQYRVDQQFGGGEESEPPPVEARQLLANAKTVAFYPPDMCLDNKQQGTRSIVARCGTVLSELERDAERAGYEVVSWVNLRGDKRPIEYAREANVDVLFEINELLPQQVSDSEVQRTLTFFERDEHGNDKDLGVSQSVAERCRKWATRDQPVTPGLTSTLDIKTVSVTDGRARWHYRKTVSQATGQEFPQVRFVGTTMPSTAGQKVMGAGLGVALSGVIFALVDSSVNSGTDPVTGEPKMKVFGSAPYYMIGIGGALAVVGIGLMVSTGQAKPEPGNVLCLEEHVPKDTPKQQTDSGPVSSEHKFSETTV